MLSTENELKFHFYAFSLSMRAPLSTQDATHLNIRCDAIERKIEFYVRP